MCTDCSCSTVNIETATTAEATAAAVFILVGMTCGGCASSVSTSIGKLNGFTSVDVTNGTVTVHATTLLDDDQIRATVEDAGYQLASAY